jgi:hypothetical protein
LGHARAVSVVDAAVAVAAEPVPTRCVLRHHPLAPTRGHSRDGARRGHEDRYLWNTWIFERVSQPLISSGAGHAPEIPLVATPSVSACRVCVWRPLPHQNDALQRIFPRRQHTRTERHYGQMRRHHFGRSVDGGLWGQTAQVLIDAEAVRLEPAEHLLVS